jgi:hypothetical protein
MGQFTNSYVVVGSTAEALVDFYRAQGTRAFIFQGVGNRCAICDDNDDEADLGVIAELTGRLQVTALLGQVFDSSVFVGTIYDRGEAVDEYIDSPEYRLESESGESILYLNRDLSTSQRATEWASLFGVPQNADALAEVLRRRDDHLFAEDFYASLLQALELPTFMVGTTYGGLVQLCETDPEAKNDLIHASGGSSQSR